MQHLEVSGAVRRFF